MNDSLFKEQFNGKDQQPQYFKLTGYINKIIYDENRQTFFAGCPTCKKKVQQESANYYRCEGCQKSLSPNELRMTYTITGKFQDQTDGVFISFIGEQGDSIMGGMKAGDFKEMKEKASFE